MENPRIYTPRPNMTAKPRAKPGLAKRVMLWFLAMFATLFQGSKLPEVEGLKTGDKRYFVVAHKLGKTLRTRSTEDPNEVDFIVADMASTMRGVSFTILNPDHTAMRLSIRHRRAIVAAVRRRLVKADMRDIRKARGPVPAGQVRKAPRLSYAGALLKAARLSKIANEANEILATVGVS